MAVPAEMPVTPPPPLTVATDVLLLVQEIPPVVASVKNDTALTQTSVLPLIGRGAEFTVIL